MYACIFFKKKIIIVISSDACIMMFSKAMIMRGRDEEIRTCMNEKNWLKNKQ